MITMAMSNVAGGGTPTGHMHVHARRRKGTEACTFVAFNGA